MGHLAAAHIRGAAVAAAMSDSPPDALALLGVAAATPAPTADLDDLRARRPHWFTPDPSA